MKQIQKVSNIILKFPLLIDFSIMISILLNDDSQSILGYTITEPVLWTGIIAFIYAVLFVIAYIIKIIVFVKLEKYEKGELMKDIGLTCRTIMSILMIVALWYIQGNQIQNQDDLLLKKPVIYLYPETQMNVQVKLNNPQKLTHTYPKYINGWNVIANPDGNIIDKDTGRNLYCLYWEGNDNTKIDMSEGFVIQGKNTIEFLEEKLSLLGLNEREANEFIIYWLPLMENNTYNYIRFRTESEINNYMKLDISPKPDSVIRISMDFKPLDRYIEVKEQELTTPNRTGFTVVEWGAREL